MTHNQIDLNIRPTDSVEESLVHMSLGLCIPSLVPCSNSERSEVRVSVAAYSSIGEQSGQVRFNQKNSIHL